MFSGENNRMLDSFYFRLAIKTAAFLVWFAFSYLVLNA